MANYKLYTHNDLDGAGCAVLAKLMWGDSVDIEYCRNPNDVTDRLNKAKLTNYDLVFIADCSFIYQNIHNNVDLSKIRLFDHHATAKNLKDKLQYATVTETLNDKNTCGTELFYLYLKKHGFTKSVDYFVEQVRLYDTWDWTKGTSAIPNYLSMLVFSLGISYFVNTYVNRLSKADLNDLTIFNDKERIILDYESTRQQKELERQLKQVQIIETTEYRLGVIVGDYNMSTLGNAICDTYDVDIAIGINLMRKAINVRTSREDIDLGKLMSKYFKGGGHPQSAGGCLYQLNTKGIYEDILSYYFGFITFVRSNKNV